MRALFCENSSNSSFSPRLGTVNVTPSNNRVVGGQERHDDFAGQFAAGDVFDDVLNSERQHVAFVAPMPAVSFTVETPTMEPWRMRTKLHHATSSSGSSEKMSMSTILALTMTDRPA